MSADWAPQRSPVALEALELRLMLSAVGGEIESQPQGLMAATPTVSIGDASMAEDVVSTVGTGLGAPATTTFVEVGTRTIDGQDYTVWDMKVDTDTDWLLTRLTILLTSGEFYQSDMGSDVEPNPAIFGVAPDLEWDTYATVPSGYPGIPGFADAEIDVTTFAAAWFDTTDDGPGIFTIARLTLSDDANGTLSGRSWDLDTAEVGVEIAGLSVVNGRIVDPFALGGMSFEVTLSEAAAGAVTVEYDTIDVSASAGVDYVAVSGTLTFAAGETTKEVVVPILADSDPENDEMFIVRLSDPTGAMLADSQGIGTIENDDPDAVDDAFTLDEDADPTPLDLLDNDTYPDNDPADLTITNVTQPAHGVVTIDGDLLGVTYTPADDYFGPDSFTYTIGNGGVGADTATVSLTVTSVNDDPSAADDDLTVVALIDGGPVALDVLAGDTYLPDGPEILTITGTTDGAHGTVEITGGGTGLTYQPAVGYEGDDDFTYTISDGNGGSDTATVVVTVTDGLLLTIGTGLPATLSYTDLDGSSVTITMKGGTAAVRLRGDVQLQAAVGSKSIIVTGGWAQAGEITLAGTNAKSALTVKTGGGATPGATVDEIVGDAPVGKLTAATLDLVGDGIQMTGVGYIASIRLDDLADGADIVMPGAGAVKGVSITAGELGADTEIALGGALKALTAVRWLGGSLTATYAGSISLKGDKATGAVGTLGADLTLTDADAKGVALKKLTAGPIGDVVLTADAGAVGTVKAAEWTDGLLDALAVKSVTIGGEGDFGADAAIAGQLDKLSVAGDVTGEWTVGSVKNATIRGNLDGAVWTLTRAPDRKLTALGKLTVAGWIDGTRILSAGGVGKVTAGAMRDSTLFAGTFATADVEGDGGPDGVFDLPVAADVAAGTRASIKALSITGKVPLPGGAALANSSVAAADILSIKLFGADFDNAGTPFGFAADTIKKLSYRDADGKASWKNLLDPDDYNPATFPSDPTDLAVLLV